MAEIWLKIKHLLRSVFEYVWGYLGTLSAMGLLLGVLGMGIYHAGHTEDSHVIVRSYTGMYNCSGAEPPVGLGLLPDGDNKGRTEHLCFEFSGSGRRLERIRHYNVNGELSAMPGSRVAEQRLSYDEAGRLVKKANFGALGEAVADGSGVSVREFMYDGQGRLVGRVFRDACGRKIVPRMPGFAEERISYDDKGRLKSILYLDGNGMAVTNARGESLVTFTYNDEQNEVIRSNQVKGRPADNVDGVASECVRKTKDGLITHTSWQNAAGNRVSRGGGELISLLEEYQPAEMLRRLRRCGKDGVMMGNGRVWAEHLVRTTPRGNVEWECFNAADGLPCLNHALGYAERVCEYDAEGNLQNEFFWDEQGNPSPCYEKRHVGEGENHHVLSLHTDGSTLLAREPSDATGK